MNLSPLPIQKFFGNNGRPLAGGLLFTYAAGTSDKIATYTDASGNSQNTNPIVLDFRGECRIWLDPKQSYKFVLSPPGDTDPPTRPIWTVDDITVAPQAFDNAADDIGTVNNISLIIPQVSSPVAFTRIVFKAANTNTGATTLQVNGGTAHDVTLQSGQPLSGGEITGGGIYEAIFDGANWQLQSQLKFPRTEAERAAGVIPIRYDYPEGDGRRYGMVGDDSTDNTSALASLRSVAAQGVACFIPAGIYRYQESPNWDIPFLELSGETGTVLKHTGSGIAFVIDGGAEGGPGLRYGLRISDLIIDGNEDTTVGFYSRGAVHTVVRNVRVRNCTDKAFWIRHGVSNLYDSCICSGNGDPMDYWPEYGFFIDKNGDGYYTADCTFLNPIAEAFGDFGGTWEGYGFYIADGSGNTVLGGTFEAVGTGIYIGSTSRHNSFDGIWMEGNEDNDIVDEGTANSFINMHCSSIVTNNVVARGTGASFYGGYIRGANLNAASNDTYFAGVAFANTVGISGTGSYRTSGCYRVGASFEYIGTVPDRLGPKSTFTGTLTGVTATVTGTIGYTVNGAVCTLEFPSTLTGTSNATTATITGVPTSIRPIVAQRLAGWVIDNGVVKWGQILIETDGSITLSNGVGGTAFTSSGTKGVTTNTLTYRLF